MKGYGAIDVGVVGIFEIMPVLKRVTIELQVLEQKEERTGSENHVSSTSCADGLMFCTLLYEFSRTLQEPRNFGRHAAKIAQGGSSGGKSRLPVVNPKFASSRMYFWTQKTNGVDHRQPPGFGRHFV
jgi:hypothetical protein